jgi:outer membrane protein insertion porin family
MKLASRLILCVLFLAAIGFPQNAIGFPQKKTAAKKTTPARKAVSVPAPAPNKWPIQSISVAGISHYSAAQVIAVSGLKVGQLAGKSDFEAARERLLATGVFETVGYHFMPASGTEAYVASFDVSEVEPLYTVHFERLEVPDADLKTWLHSRDPFFGDRIPATQKSLDRQAQAIEAYLTSKGHPQNVIGRIVSDLPNQFDIVFAPASREAAIAEVRFEGNRELTTKALLDSFGGVAAGVPYREASFRQMLNVGVRPLYEARGRILVKFPSIRTEPAKEVEGLVVTVTVDEGPEFTFGKIAIAGTTPVAPAQLLKAGDLKEAAPANFDEVTAALGRMRKVLRKAGYMTATLDVKRAPDEKAKKVDLNISVQPGPQFTFGRLTLEGLDLNGEAAIKKMWTMKPGKPYDADYPDFFLARVREENIFEGLGATKAIPKVDEKERVVDVTLHFGAAPPEPGADRAKKPDEPF